MKGTVLTTFSTRDCTCQASDRACVISSLACGLNLTDKKGSSSEKYNLRRRRPKRDEVLHSHPQKVSSVVRGPGQLTHCIANERVVQWKGGGCFVQGDSVV